MSKWTNCISFTLIGFFFGFVLFLCTFSPGQAVNCYECSSVNDSRCMDPFDKVADFYVNCSIEYPQAQFCRKIDQTVRGKQRVFRRCAWEEHKNRDCYNGANAYYRAKICICRDDGCNGATHLQWVSPFVLLVPVFLFFMQ